MKPTYASPAPMKMVSLSTSEHLSACLLGRSGATRFCEAESFERFHDCLASCGQQGAASRIDGEQGRSQVGTGDPIDLSEVKTDPLSSAFGNSLVP